MTTKPNILILFSDQHARRFSGCYGHPVVRTPNLDRLASSGLRFEGAVCNSPLCGPSRMALMTGQRVSTIEIWDNNLTLGSDVRTLGHRLNDAGYETALCGRMHFNGADKLHGFHQQLANDPEANASIPNWAAGGEVPEHSLTAEVMAKRPKVGDGYPDDDVAADRAVTFLREHADSEKPWAMVVGFKHPHGPWNAEQRYWDLYDEREIDMPAPMGPADNHPIHERNRRLRQMPEAGYPEEVVRRNRHGYYAVISRMDDKVGQVLDALEASGARENTIVVYISDHGEMLGEHGLWMKSAMFEESIGVPMIFSGPGIPEGTCDKNLSLIDLTATLCDLAGADTKGMDGRSFRCLVDGVGEWDNMSLSEHFATWTDRPLAALRRANYKLIAGYQEAPQLFDLEADPREEKDLAGAPAFAEIRKALADELASIWDAKALHNRIVDSQQTRIRKSAS